MKNSFRISKIFLSLVLALSFSACGGGGNEADLTSNIPGGGTPSDTSGGGTPSDTTGGATPPDTTAPTASLVPTHSSNNVDSTTNIVATFDEDMLASTINAANFTLSDVNGELGAIVSFDALSNIATLTPNTSLGLLKNYTARLKTGITDLNGNPLAHTQTTFTTRDGSWNGPTFLLEGASGGDSDSVKMAVSPNGDATVVFQKSDNGVLNIYAAHYSVIDGWSLPVRLDVGNKNSYDPQVAADANGNAIAVWTQGLTELSLDDVYANRYTTASGWGTAEIIDNRVLGVLQAPSIAMDPAGNATVVWNQDINGTDTNVFINSYNSSTGNWAVAASLLGQRAQQENPKVALGPNGTRIISWKENGGNLTTMVSLRGQTVMFDTQVNTNSRGSIQQYQAIVDSNGNTTIVWEQPDFNSINIYARYFPAGGTSWSAATLLSSRSRSGSSKPSLAVDPAGNVIAVWVELDAISFDVWASRFSNFSKTWGTAELIENGTGDIRTIPTSVKIAAAGINAFSAIWTQANAGGTFDVWTNRFTPNGWVTAEMIESSPGSSKSAVVGFDSNGNGVASWIQTNAGRGAVHARHFN